jgi:hypothetical protein
MDIYIYHSAMKVADDVGERAKMLYRSLPDCAIHKAHLLGKILFIDADNATNGESHAIPKDNPFAGTQCFQRSGHAV